MRARKLNKRLQSNSDHRTLRPRSLYALLMAAILGMSPASGYALPKIVSDSSGVVVQNDSAFEYVALIVERDGTTQKHFVSGQTLVLAPHAIEKLPAARSGDSVNVELAEVIVDAPLLRIAGNCQAQPMPASDLGALQSDLQKTDLTNTPAAAEQYRIAAEIAELEDEQRMDERQTERLDPLSSYTLLRQDLEQIERNSTPAAAVIEAETQRVNDNAEAVASAATDLGEVWSQKNSARLADLQNQAAAISQLLTKVQDSQRAAQLRYQRAGLESSAGANFLQSEFDAFAKTNKPADFRPGNPSPIAKVCSRPSDLEDFVSMTVPAPDAVSVLLGKASFDKGAEQSIVFRRVKGTNQWVARIYWPLSAQSVRMKVQSREGSWTNLPGAVSAGRGSYDQELVGFSKAVSMVQKKYKEASFRGDGGDDLTTIPIP